MTVKKTVVRATEHKPNQIGRRLMKNTNVIIVVAALVIIAVVGYFAIDKGRQASEAQKEIARLSAEVERLTGEKEKIEKE